MIIEIGYNGIRARYYYTTHNVSSDVPAQATYQAVRERYQFLTEDNHTWEAVDYGLSKPDESVHLVKLRELTGSYRYVICINRTEPHGPWGLKHWFSVPYRVPGEAY